MKKSEKILFVVGLCFTVAALAAACLAAYFGISFAVSEMLHGAADQLARAFLSLFLILFTLIAWSLSLLALLCFFLRPVRSENAKVRRLSRICLCLVAGFSLLDGVLWLLCLI